MKKFIFFVFASFIQNCIGGILPEFVQKLPGIIPTEFPKIPEDIVPSGVVPGGFLPGGVLPPVQDLKCFFPGQCSKPESSQSQSQPQPQPPSDHDNDTPNYIPPPRQPDVSPHHPPSPPYNPRNRELPQPEEKPLQPQHEQSEESLTDEPDDNKGTTAFTLITVILPSFVFALIF